MPCARLQVNNGVYKSGFATSQAAYERAQADLWTWLDILEEKLSQHRFLTGSRCVVLAMTAMSPSDSCRLRLLLPYWKWLRGEYVFSRFTLADLQLFPTIVRFDAMYATLFKCSRKRIKDFPNLQGWLCDVYQLQTNPDGMQVSCHAFTLICSWSLMSFCVAAVSCRLLSARHLGCLKPAHQGVESLVAAIISPSEFEDQRDICQEPP